MDSVSQLGQKLSDIPPQASNVSKPSIMAAADLDCKIRSLNMPPAFHRRISMVFQMLKCLEWIRYVMDLLSNTQI